MATVGFKGLITQRTQRKSSHARNATRELNPFSNFAQATQGLTNLMALLLIAWIFSRPLMLQCCVRLSSVCNVMHCG